MGTRAKLRVARPSDSEAAPRRLCRVHTDDRKAARPRGEILRRPQVPKIPQCARATGGPQDSFSYPPKRSVRRSCCAGGAPCPGCPSRRLPRFTRARHSQELLQNERDPRPTQFRESNGRRQVSAERASEAAPLRRQR